VDFYIHKPINRVEVVAVLRKVLASHRLTQSLSKVRQSLAILEVEEPKRSANTTDYDSRMRMILRDLGLAGGIGNRELQWLAGECRKGMSIEGSQLKDLYLLIQEHYLKDFNENIDIGTIEQRIRRAVHEAMDQLVSLGKEDYHNPIFEHYGPRFFDFNEMRTKLRDGKAKINLKKFIAAFCDEVNS
jgi:two-component system, response regulator YcbB